MRRTFGLKEIFLPCLLLILVLPSAARGAEIMVLQSARIPAYDDALQGLAAILSQDIPGQKAIQAHAVNSHVLSEAASTIHLREQIIGAQPDLLVAIGSSSLSLVKDLAGIPILYLMVPFPEVHAGSRNITGINMNISGELQLKTLAAAVPGANSIGLLYDPERSDALVNESRAYAAQNHLNLVAVPVHKADEVPAQLDSLKGRIDWLWMVPDLTVLTPQTIDYMLLFSLENKVPIFTFAKKYLDQGAVLSVTFDPYDMGKQAGEMALKILHGTSPGDLPPERVRKVVVERNSKAAQMLGIVLRNGEEAR